MGTSRMHAGEIETDVALVRRLLTGQFPRWAGMLIEAVASYGTDHDIYRLGDHVGDPACDLQPAWNVFAGHSRARFRWDTNPGMIRQATHALAQVLFE